ncbi:MAG: hypothetical protein FJY17_09180 [Bacteroidetes bacterium]|nr:hypothetical protein [Bacteroidota bacterium]
MKKVSLILTAVFITAMLVTSCGGGGGNESASSNEVTIGNQVWMTKNLNVDWFRNGDPVPQARTNEEWAIADIYKQPAWCYYDNDPTNGVKYGKLYNWYAVSDDRGLAPVGYHIPSDAEWTNLEDYLGSFAGTEMKSKSGWLNNGNGTNSSGFNGLPGGFRFNPGTFYGIGEFGYWWSTTEYTHFAAWCRYLHYKSGNVERTYHSYVGGLPVRCLRD